MGLRLEIKSSSTAENSFPTPAQFSKNRTQGRLQPQMPNFKYKAPRPTNYPCCLGVYVSLTNRLTFRDVPKCLHSLSSLFGTGRTRSDTATPLTCEPRQVKSQPLGFWSFNYQHILLCPFTAPLAEELPKLSLQDYSLGAPHSLLLFYILHTCA